MKAGQVGVLLLGLLIGTQLIGADQPGFLPALYAVFPYILLIALPATLLYNAMFKYRLASMYGALSLYALAVLTPAVFGGPADVPDSAPRLSVLFANTWQSNPDPAEAMRTVLAQQADIVVLTEFNDRALGAADIAAMEAAYSTVMIGQTEFVVMTNLPTPNFNTFTTGFKTGSEFIFNLDGRSVSVFAVHPPAPNKRTSGAWFSGLTSITRRLPVGAQDTIVVGDFNTPRWQPMFTKIVDLGYRNAHDVLGEGLSPSWPVLGHRYPAFVRIDHAFVSAGVEPLDVSNVTIPGSDHRGFLLEVAFTD